MPRVRLPRNASAKNNNTEIDAESEDIVAFDSVSEVIIDPFEFQDDDPPKHKKVMSPPTEFADSNASNLDGQSTEPVVLPRRGRPPKIPENLLELFKDADEVPGIGPKPIIRLAHDPLDINSPAGTKKRLSAVQSRRGKLDTGNVKCDLCERTFSNVSGYKRHLKACAESRAPPLVVKVQKIPLEEAVASGEIDQNEMDTVFEISDDFCPDREVAQEIIVSALDGTCPCCGEDASTAHQEGTVECPKCEKRFNSEDGLQRHVKVAHKSSRLKVKKTTYNCPDCLFVASNKTQFTKHVLTHAPPRPGGKVYTCKQCNKHFNRKYHLDRHVVQMGCDGRPKAIFPCEVCGKTFSRKDNLREHLRGHEGQVKRKRKLACEHCQKEFYGLSMLQIHIRTHTGEKPFNCDQCDKAFVSNNALSKHMRTHSGERPFACQDCGARFAAKETLNRHVKIHTGEKPHVCDFCGKGFIQPSQLKAHLFHHNGEHGFICEQCGKSFNRRTRLTLHIKYVHQGAEPFSCDQCGKNFIRKEDLSRHEMLHAGVKPHECDLCHKRFTIKSALKTHLLTHTREAPTMCDECGRAFIRQDCLLRHMRLKHRAVLEQIMADAEKRKLQQQMLAVTNASPKSLSEDNSREHSTLSENVSELLTVLVDEKTLESFNWPSEDVGVVLESVIKRCGHEPVSTEQELEKEKRLRANSKLLFTAVIDDAAVKALLNNQSVDEVILHVLRLAKS